MVEATISGRRIRVVLGDITALDIEAFVFAARPDLELGSGFGTAISMRGGPSIREELRPLAPVAVGESVVTGAGNLKAKYIIHAVGPRFQEEDEEPKLERATRSALARAAEKGIRALALPPLGYGFYGVPAETCAKVMLRVVKEHLAGETTLSDVVFCMRDPKELTVFEAGLKALA